jgi:CRP/FNR family transcriptional regulator, cyclic AMP receptor protein
MTSNLPVDGPGLIANLRRIPLFKKFDDAFFPVFTKRLSVRRYSVSELVIYEGDRGREMYFLLSGVVRVNKKTMDGDLYSAALLKAEYGVFFGEIGLLTEDTRSASIVCESEAEIAIMKAEDFLAFVEEQPLYGARLTIELAASICQKLIKANKDTIILYEALLNEIGAQNLGLASKG